MCICLAALPAVAIQRRNSLCGWEKRKPSVWFTQTPTRTSIALCKERKYSCYGSLTLLLISKWASSFLDVPSLAVDDETRRLFKNLPHHRVVLTAGDCLYVPRGWYHKVFSFGRTIAISTWVHAPVRFDSKECFTGGPEHAQVPISPLDDFARPTSVEILGHLLSGAVVDQHAFIYGIQPSTATYDELFAIFRDLDTNKDGQLDIRDVSSLLPLERQSDGSLKQFSIEEASRRFEELYGGKHRFPQAAHKLNLVEMLPEFTDDLSVFVETTSQA
eukprot:m.94268 g.94268  ORF g.94268 m.94268 type:complete len:274 (+) comp14719_c0_seq7:641-1462(+)